MIYSLESHVLTYSNIFIYLLIFHLGLNWERVMTRAICLFWLMGWLDFRRFHRNRCAFNGSNGPHIIGLLSNPSPLKESQSTVYTSGFILWLDFRQLKWTRLCFRSNFLTRLHWTPGFVHWNLVESIGHVGRALIGNLMPFLTGKLNSTSERNSWMHELSFYRKVCLEDNKREASMI